MAVDGGGGEGEGEAAVVVVICGDSNIMGRMVVREKLICDLNGKLIKGYDRNNTS